MRNFSTGVKIQEYVDIKNYTTLQIGGQFKYLVEINKKEDLFSIFRMIKKENRFKNLPILVLGGGSNSVFPDGVLEAIVLKIDILGFQILREDKKNIEIKIGAGEDWDQIVEKTVKMNLSGFECLSAIPGKVGATPVQNVGAYGSEVKDTITEVEVFEISTQKIKNLSNQDCQFGYRDSIFKNKAKGKYIIIGVSYKLSKSSPSVPDYPGVKNYFINNDIKNPSLAEIRQVIIDIRQEKLPDPKKFPNVGSFFKNPIVSEEVVLKLKEKYLDLKTFPVEENKVKIPAGWLIEKAGLKGKSFGSISVYEKNALVLVNNGGGTKEDLMKAKNQIVKIIEEKFNIILEQEPEII